MPLLPRYVNSPFLLHLDADIERTVAPVTLERYRKSLANFVLFLNSKGIKLDKLEEVDTASIWCKQNHDLTRSDLAYLIASLELLFTKLKKVGLEHLRRAATVTIRASKQSKQSKN